MHFALTNKQHCFRTIQVLPQQFNLMVSTNANLTNKKQKLQQLENNMHYNNKHSIQNTKLQVKATKYTEVNKYMYMYMCVCMRSLQ